MFLLLAGELSSQNHASLLMVYRSQLVLLWAGPAHYHSLLLKECVRSVGIRLSPFSEWLSHFGDSCGTCQIMLSGQLCTFLSAVLDIVGIPKVQPLPLCSGFISALVHWRFSNRISNFDFSPWPLTWISNSLLGISLPLQAPRVWYQIVHQVLPLLFLLMITILLAADTHASHVSSTPYLISHSVQLNFSVLIKMTYLLTAKYTLHFPTTNTTTYRVTYQNEMLQGAPDPPIKSAFT